MTHPLFWVWEIQRACMGNASFATWDIKRLLPTVLAPARAMKIDEAVCNRLVLPIIEPERKAIAAVRCVDRRVWQHHGNNAQKHSLEICWEPVRMFASNRRQALAGTSHARDVDARHPQTSGSASDPMNQPELRPSLIRRDAD
jgi:hypothetical protein